MEDVLAIQTISGRVLTRHRVQKEGFSELSYYLKTADGAVLVHLPQSDFICFCAEHHSEQLASRIPSHQLTVKAVSLSSFSGELVSALYCHSRQGFNLLNKTAIDLGIELFESDIRPENRFLIERYITLDITFAGHFASTKSITHSGAVAPSFNAVRAKKADLDIKLSAISLDLECSMEGELYSVGFYGVQEDSNKKGLSKEGRVYQRVIMIGEEPVVSESAINRSKSLSSSYIQWVNDESQLIQALVDWFREYDPDLIIGWAVITFDLALLYRRANTLNIPLSIGRGGSVLSWKVANKYRAETLNLPGRVVLDGIDWLKAAFYRFDSFSLENVARELLQEGKALPSGADGINQRGGEITELFKYDKLALAHYNITDCRLVWDIFDQTQLFEFVIARSKLTGLELGRVGGSVAAFNNLYLPHLHRAGYVSPSRAVSQGLESPGGYVMNSLPGLYNNILVLDFKSLYPSIIRTFLIDPKGLIEGVSQPKDESIAGFLGAKFSRHQPILPKLIRSLSDAREQAKQEGNRPLSQAIKIIMNSFYGVLGSQSCVFHDAKLASSITMRGHEIMKQTKTWIEERGYKVIYGDTDSTFVWIEGEITNQQINHIAKKLVTDINKAWQQKLAQEFRLTSYLELEFESHYRQFFMPTLRGSTTGSKKRYVGGIRDENGKLELIFKGMEQVRSDWSPIAKRIQKQLYYRLFNGEDITDFLCHEIKKLKTGQLDAELVLTKRLRRNVVDYTAKSSPHIRAAKLKAERSGDNKQLNKGAKIDYLMTLNGAEPIEYLTAKIDYEYYINRQLAPIAEPILAILNLNFKSLTSSQLSLI